jgi:hypothetical protein
VPKPFSKSLAIPNILAQKSASSAFCTPGSQKLGLHPHVHCVIPAGGLSPMARAGSNHAMLSFFPSRCSARVFRGKFVAVSSEPSRTANSTFTEIWHCSPSPRPSPPGSDYCSERTGWSIANATLRRPRVCAPVSGPLHAPRGHLQPSPGLVGRRQGHFPLARLRSPQRTEVADPSTR